MARGIILFGPAGSGKTTLGRLVAEALGFPYLSWTDMSGGRIRSGHLL